MNNHYAVGDVARWLWQRFTGDSGANYTALERAHLAAILARRTDLATLIDPRHPSAVYRAADLERQPLASLVAGLEASELALDSSNITEQLKANTNVAMAVNFIRATPFAFAMEAK
jgi:enoyl-CoA hydratase/carnithine racemase